MKDEKFHTKGLQYYCNQNIQDFKPTANGLHCHMCNKTLVDFRDKTKAEYERIVKETPDGCGIFYADQIGDATEITFNWKKPLVAASFVASLLFSQKVMAQSSSKEPIELRDSTQFVKTDTSICSEKKSKASKNNKTVSQTSTSRNKRRYRKKLYISGHFPFIHYGHRIQAAGYW